MKECHIKATSIGTPPLSGAEVLAWMLAAMTGKKPVLKVVDEKKTCRPKASPASETEE